MKKLILFILALVVFTVSNAQQYETLADDFNRDTAGWFQNKETDLSVLFSDGKLCFDNQSSKSKFPRIYLLVDPNDDYSIETKIGSYSVSVNLDDQFFGIIWGFGGVGNANYFCFLVNPKGAVWIAKFNADGRQDLYKEVFNGIGYKEIPLAMKVSKSSSGMQFSVNDKIVYTCQAYKHGGTGFSFYVGANQKIDFDYLKIYRRKLILNLVDNPINGYKLENLGPEINSEYSEIGPLISSDGKVLFVTRNHPDNTGGIDDENDVWFSEKNADGKWEKMQNIGSPINTKGPNFVISVTPDSNSLLLGNHYYSDGTIEGKGISLSRKRDGKWQLPDNQIIDNFTKTSNYVDFCLSPDGMTLISAICNDSTYGDRDLFVSFMQENGHWSEPRNMGITLNTFTREGTPFVAADGKTLYFSSQGHPGYGDQDIFVSRRLDDTWLNWSEPQNLGPEINSKDGESSFTLSAQGDYAYMVSSNPEISLGGGDIFRIKLSKSASIDPVVLVSGYVYNRKTNEIIDAQISYEDLKTGKEVGRAFSTKQDGFKIALPRGSVYGYRAEAQGFVSLSENLDLSSLESYKEKKMNLYLVPIEKGEIVRLNNIFFDYNKSELKPESFPELNRLISFMKQNPDLRIEIAGHTDNSGSSEYNMGLSGDRASSVKRFLVSQGIDPQRVSSKSYGETKPLSSNETDEGRQLNRRVEFKIL
jgi:OmpA-OmpF porin, OOP family